jgi:hypothetical protein
MPRKPRHGKERTPELTDGLIEFFETGKEDFEVWACSEDKLKELWALYRKNLLPEFIKQNLCQRPFGWWEYDAPRWDDPYTDCYYHGTLPESRQRLGGVGDPIYEHLAYVPNFRFGLPTSWISTELADYYRKKENDFQGVPINPSNPSVFESEAMYLKRHGLLTKQEALYLEKHPKLLKPEIVEEEAF